jgi:hypothetical protein
MLSGTATRADRRMLRDHGRIPRGRIPVRMRLPPCFRMHTYLRLSFSAAQAIGK